MKNELVLFETADKKIKLNVLIRYEKYIEMKCLM